MKVGVCVWASPDSQNKQLHVNFAIISAQHNAKFLVNRLVIHFYASHVPFVKARNVNSTKGRTERIILFKTHEKYRGNIALSYFPEALQIKTFNFCSPSQVSKPNAKKS